MSRPVMDGIAEVLRRPKFARAVPEDFREGILGLLAAAASGLNRARRWPTAVDPKDNKYLELALAASAGVIVSSDEDLLALHPWRGLRILRPRDFLATAGEERDRTFPTAIGRPNLPVSGMGAERHGKPNFGDLSAGSNSVDLGGSVRQGKPNFPDL